MIYYAFHIKPNAENETHKLTIGGFPDAKLNALYNMETAGNSIYSVSIETSYPIASLAKGVMITCHAKQNSTVQMDTSKSIPTHPYHIPLSWTSPDFFHLLFIQYKYPAAANASTSDTCNILFSPLICLSSILSGIFYGILPCRVVLAAIMTLKLRIHASLCNFIVANDWCSSASTIRAHIWTHVPDGKIEV